MEVACPVCQGLGVVVRMEQPKVVDPKNPRPQGVKVLCPTCNGTGLVVAGYLARELGLLK